MGLFRLTWHDTDEPDPYLCEDDHRHEFYGDARAILVLWFTLTRKLDAQFVKIYNGEGMLCNPEHGLAGMIDYHI